MRNQKWWWSIFIWALGVAATNAYLVSQKVCEAEGVTPKSPRSFMVELCDQLCHREKRRVDQAGNPKHDDEPGPSSASKRPRAAAAAAGGSAGGGSASKQPRTPKAAPVRPPHDSGGKSGARGQQIVSTMTDDTVKRAREQCPAAIGGGIVRMCEPPTKEGGRKLVDCQMCRWNYDGRKRAPQNRCVMICEFCNHGVCSVECWNDLHFGK